MMSFATKLKPLVERTGAPRAAELCGVTRRTINYWLAKPDKAPCRAMQVGTLSLLREAAAELGRCAAKNPRADRRV